MATVEKRKKASAFQVSTFAGLGISVIVHMTIFLIVGSVVIFEGKVPNAPFFSEFMGDDAGPATDEIEMPLLEEEVLDVPMETPMDELMTDSIEPTLDQTLTAPEIIVSAAPSTSFSMPVGVGTPKVEVGDMNTGRNPMKKLNPTATGPKGAGTLFGFTESFTGALEGTMVDFKQDSKGKPTGMTPSNFGKAIRKFVKRSSWSLNKLDDYYVVDKKLYTTHIYMPRMNADAAPKAFNVADKVQPKMWMVLYRGKFVAPKSEKYRFWGLGDDYLFVKVDGKLVLDASLYVGRSGKSDFLKPTDWNKDHQIGDSAAVGGKWMEFEAGSTHDIEILLAEQPGGVFYTFLFIEEEGKKYDKGYKGRPQWPLFQTAKADVELKGGAPAYPRFEKRGGLFAP